MTKAQANTVANLHALELVKTWESESINYGDHVKVIIHVTLLDGRLIEVDEEGVIRIA